MKVLRGSLQDEVKIFMVSRQNLMPLNPTMLKLNLVRRSSNKNMHGGQTYECNKHLSPIITSFYNSHKEKTSFYNVEGHCAPIYRWDSVNLEVAHGI
jgi:hypothetical protein